MNRILVLISLSDSGIETIKSTPDLPKREMEFVNQWKQEGLLESFFISVSKKEAVLISLVRSNVKGEIGFLGDTRRMNVALTRARRRLWVVGDSATLSQFDFYKAFLDYAHSIGAWKSYWE